MTSKPINEFEWTLEGRILEAKILSWIEEMGGNEKLANLIMAEQFDHSCHKPTCFFCEKMGNTSNRKDLIRIVPYQLRTDYQRQKLRIFNKLIA